MKPRTLGVFSRVQRAGDGSTRQSRDTIVLREKLSTRMAASERNSTLHVLIPQIQLRGQMSSLNFAPYQPAPDEPGQRIDHNAASKKPNPWLGNSSSYQSGAPVDSLDGTHASSSTQPYSSYESQATEPDAWVTRFAPLHCAFICK
jgi:hypothetical protein